MQLEKSLHPIQVAWQNSGIKAPQLEKRRVGSYELRFNPDRALYMQSTKEADPNTDVFCRKWQSIKEKESLAEFKLPNFNWQLIYNLNPIEEHHSLLVVEGHQPQGLTEMATDDLMEISKQFPDITIGFNGWQAGASQNHLHAHVMWSDFPILSHPTKQGILEGLPVTYFHYQDPRETAGFIDDLTSVDIRYNALFSGGSVLIAPRRTERDSDGIRRGFDTVFGKILTISHAEMYSKADADITNMLRALIY